MLGHSCGLVGSVVRVGFERGVWEGDELGQRGEINAFERMLCLAICVDPIRPGF